VTRGIREPFTHYPTHGGASLYLVSLVTSVVLAREEIDPHHEIDSARLDLWGTKHRPELARCRHYDGDPFKEDRTHAAEVATIDAFIDALRRGLAEGNAVQHVDQALIEQTREARERIRECKTRAIYY
jgi:hypothetical protein